MVLNYNGAMFCFGAQRMGYRFCFMRERCEMKVELVVILLVIFVFVGGHGELKRPLFHTVKFGRSRLHGIAFSGSAVGVPFELPIQVKKGDFRWYDKVCEGDLLFAQGLYGKAFHVYDEVLGMDGLPEEYKSPVLLSVARTLVLKNRVFEARKVVLAAMDMATSEQVEQELYFNLGIFAVMRGDWMEAEQAFEKSLELNDKHVDSLNHLAMLYFVLGRLEDFKTTFLAALKVFSKNAQARQEAVFAQYTTNSYRSSFAKSNLHGEMAIWFVDHVMRIFQVDGAPSFLSSLSLREETSAVVPDGYRPGELEANLVLVFSNFQSVMKNEKLDRQLVHYNLAKRLAKVGAWDLSALHFNLAAESIDNQRRRILQLRSALMLQDEALKRYETLLQQWSNELTNDDETATHMFNCMALSKDSLLPTTLMDHTFEKVVLNCCSITGKNTPPSPKRAVQDGKFRVGIVATDMTNSNTNKMLVPIIGSLTARRDMEVIVFSWQSDQNGRYLINPDIISFLPSFDLTMAIEMVSGYDVDILLFADAHENLKSYLLAAALNHRPVGRIDLADLTKMPMTFFQFIASLETTNAAGPYIRLLMDTVIRKDRYPVVGSPLIQGQYYFNNEHYYMIATSRGLVDIVSSFDAIVQDILAADPRGVVVFLAGDDDGSIITEKFWTRLSKRPIDLSKIKIQTVTNREEYISYLKNANVVLDPFPTPSPVIFLLESLHLHIPILSRSRMGTMICNEAFPFLGEHCVATNDQDYVRMAVSIADDTAESRHAYLHALKRLNSTEVNRPADGRALSQAWSNLLFKHIIQ